MRRHALIGVVGVLLFSSVRILAQEAVTWQDPSPHKIHLVTVDEGVRLEVLDWGGSGRPLVLLAGLGNTAHIFDDFASKLIPEYHVYGITRRGYGASSIPTSGYSADRLGDDIIGVLDELKIERPVFVGHSIAGQEMSSVTSRHPDRVAGLIYLDAGYSYAFYDQSRGDLNIDLQELVRKLSQLQPGAKPSNRLQLVRDLLKTELPTFEKDLQQLQASLESTPEPLPTPPPPTPADAASYQAWRAWQEKTSGFSMPEGELRQLHVTTPEGHVGALLNSPAVQQAVIAGQQKYTDIPVPALAIFALPHNPGPFASKDLTALAAFEARDIASTGAQAKAFEAGVQSARVVRLARAAHYIFLTHAEDVLREMRAFLATLG